MKSRILSLVCFLVAFIAFAFTPPAIAADSQCALAKKIGEKAALKFKKDKTEGLKLFIKAYNSALMMPALILTWDLPTIDTAT